MTGTEKAYAYLKKASLRGSKLGLERVTELLSMLGEPQEKTKIIHISGTNGKGSFGAMMTEILCRSGYTVGGFSSPYITSYTDSFRINGAEITPEELSDIINRLEPLCESMDDKPTEFEVLTAAAYELFAERNCDIALVECGMGGDLDSTNAVNSPILSVITNVRYDHCAFLGDTLEEIARHKSGIIKRGCPVLFGGSSPEAEAIVIEAAKKASSELYMTDHSRISEVCHSIGDTRFTFEGFGRLKLKMAGTYQLCNAANVLTAVEILRKTGISIPDTAVSEGLSAAQWHGRFEILSDDPLIIFDGSHNPDGIAKAAESIRLYFGEKKVTLLIGVMADKEYGLYADMLGELTDCVFTVRPDNPRALDSMTLAESFSARGISAIPFDDLADGVKAALEHAKNRNIPLIALGSLYMYREFIEALGKINFRR